MSGWLKKETRGGNAWMVWHPEAGGLLITPKPKDAQRIVDALNGAQHIECLGRAEP